ncbi:MAG: hypothetical protein ACRDJN_24165 [Chloroflexota bacterium]
MCRDWLILTVYTRIPYQKELGLRNVPAGLIFPYVTLLLALSVFVMRGMFHTISREVYDAARIDGAGLKG